MAALLLSVGPSDDKAHMKEGLLVLNAETGCVDQHVAVPGGLKAFIPVGAAGASDGFSGRMPPSHHYSLSNSCSYVFDIRLTAENFKARRYDVIRHLLNEGLTALTTTPQGDYLIAGDRRGLLQVWSTGSGTLCRSLPICHQAIEGIIYNKDYIIVCSQGFDGKVYLLSDLLCTPIAQEIQPIRSFSTVNRDGSPIVATFALTGWVAPVSGLIFCVVTSSCVHLFDIHKDEAVLSIPVSSSIAQSSKLTCARATRDGLYLSVGTECGLIFGLSFADILADDPAKYDPLVWKLEGHDSIVTDVVHNHLDASAWSAGADGLRNWDLLTGACTRHIPFDGLLAPGQIKKLMLTAVPQNSDEVVGLDGAALKICSNGLQRNQRHKVTHDRYTSLELFGNGEVLAVEASNAGIKNVKRAVDIEGISPSIAQKMLVIESEILAKLRLDKTAVLKALDEHE